MISYPNIHLVVYPPGAGGKFLINCLSLNNKTVFQHSILAEKQIDGNFLPVDKYNYLMKKLEAVNHSDKWTDLEMGSRALFGDAIADFGVSDLDVIEKKIQARPIFNKCIENNVNMFVMTHDLNEIHQKRMLFPNGKIIVFYNFRKFLSSRKQPFIIDTLKNYWNTVKDETWPEHPPTTPKEFYSLESRLQDELVNFFNAEIFAFFDYSFEDYKLWDEYDHSESKVCFFNVDLAYSHVDEFYTQYMDVCDFLDILPYDKTMIEHYFHKWSKAIIGKRWSY